MTDLNIDLSHLFSSPEIYSVIDWVPKVLALGGLIITEREDDRIVLEEPHYGFEDERPELPPLPVSPEHAAYLFHTSEILREKLPLVLADLDIFFFKLR